MKTCFYCPSCGVIGSEYCEVCCTVAHNKPLVELSLEERFRGLSYHKRVLLERDLHFFVIDLTDSEAFFSDYLKLIGNFLEDEAKIRQRINRERIELQKIDPTWLPLLETLNADELKEVDNYSQLLQRSSLVSLFSFFETRLANFCHLVGADTEWQLYDIDQAKDYLSKDLKINFSFGNSLEWEEIQQYKSIRNCIIHYQGVISKLKPKKKRQLENYINHPSVPISISKDVIVLHKDFCNLMSQVIREFFWSLVVAVSDDFVVEKYDEA